MRKWIVAAVVLAGMSGAAQAQRTESKVIDTNALVIKPVDTTTTVVGRSFQYVSRVVANTVDNNALIRTVNNLFGTKAKAAPVQPGLSPLPDPSTYPSGYFKSQLYQATPTYQTIKR